MKATPNGQTLTTGELIELLADHPLDAPVYFATPDDVYDIGARHDYDNVNIEGLTLFAYEG